MACDYRATAYRAHCTEEVAAAGAEVVSTQNTTQARSIAVLGGKDGKNPDGASQWTICGFAHKFCQCASVLGVDSGTPNAADQKGSVPDTKFHGETVEASTAMLDDEKMKLRAELLMSGHRAGLRGVASQVKARCSSVLGRTREVQLVQGGHTCRLEPQLAPRTRFVLLRWKL